MASQEEAFNSAYQTALAGRSNKNINMSKKRKLKISPKQRVGLQAKLQEAEKNAY